MLNYEDTYCRYDIDFARLIIYCTYLVHESSRGIDIFLFAKSVSAVRVQHLL